MTPPHAAPPSDPRRRHRLRNGLFGLLAFLVLVAIGLAACEAVEWPFLRHPLEEKLSQILARPVSFGEPFGVRLLGSVRAHAGSMTIGPAPAGGPALVDEQGRPRDFLRAGAAKLALGYGTLYHQWKGDGGPLHVKLLDVDGLELNLKRDADGRANWQFGASAPQASASSPQIPTFDRLTVRNGEVRYRDEPLDITADAHVATREGSAVPGGAPARAASSDESLPALRVTGGAASGAGLGASGAERALAAASGAVARVGAAASAAGFAASEAEAEAEADDGAPGLHVEASGSYKQAKLLLRLHSSGLLPIAADDADSPPVPIWLDARAGRTHIRLDGSATDLFHFGGMDAKFLASGPSLAAVGDAIGVTLPTTAPFDTHGRVRKHGAVWDADVAALSLGTSRLNGQFRFDAAPAVPKLTGTLSGSRLALADLGPAFGAPAPTAPASASAASSAAAASAPAKAAKKERAAQPKAVPPAKASQLAKAAPATTAKPGRVLPDRQFDIPSLKAMNADVGVQLAVLDLGTDALEPFTPLHARITLQDGVLDLRDILARTSMGQVTGAIGLDSRPALPAWNADLRWSGIQLARFIKTPDTMVRKNDDGSRPDTGYVSGALGGDARLAGTGKSTAALLGSLQGTTRLWVQDGQVSHLLVEAAGIDIADALGLFIKGDDKVPVQCAVAKLDLVKGKVLPEVFMIDTHESTLLVGGEMSLKDETLDLRLNSHPHNFSPWAPRGFSIVAPRTPVDVDGTFSDPHVHLEAKPLLLRGGAALALGLVNPLAALLALVDLRQPEKDVCSDAVKHLSEADRPGAVAPAASSTAPARAQAAEQAASDARHPARRRPAR
jgi:uncharacterized protein involved in outer membrane biogenesis